VVYFRFSRAAVAQLDRVLGYEPRGRGFDSCQPHQIEQGFTSSDVDPFSFGVFHFSLYKIACMKNKLIIFIAASASMLLRGVTSVAKAAFFPNGHSPRVGPARANAGAKAAGQSVAGSSLYRQFVQQCLAERGYHVIGWR
jgi:hypothetical protein